jgi:hypothetical protein
MVSSDRLAGSSSVTLKLAAQPSLTIEEIVFRHGHRNDFINPESRNAHGAAVHFIGNGFS